MECGNGHVYLPSQAANKFPAHKKKRFKLHRIPIRPSSIPIPLHYASQVTDARNLGSGCGLGRCFASEISSKVERLVIRASRNTKDLELRTSRKIKNTSRAAYAAAAYLVCKYLDHPPTSRLVGSKCRVSPVKAMTIPRLELMGAVVVTCLAKNLVRVLKVESVTFWVDSTNVLYWVRNQSRNFKAFVANRFGEIQRSTNPNQWRHIPGETNPADLPTRGLSASQLSQCQAWMEGREFLKKDESTWPEKLTGNPTSEDEECEHRKNKSTFARGDANSKKVQDRLVPEKFSSLSRLLRVTAWIKRFLTNCKLPKEQRTKSDVLGQNEISDAEIYWVRRAQTEAFPSGEKEKSLSRFYPQTDEASLL